jgi:hypothetical protein
MSRLPEYESAVRDLMWLLTHQMMAAQSPLLAQIRKEEVGHVSSGQAPGAAATGSSWPIELELPWSIQVDAMANADGEAWAAMIFEAADKGLSALMPQLFEGLDQACRKAGNVVDAQGRPLDHDMILDMLETIELAFDDAGRPQIPPMFTSPRTFEQLQRLPPPTAEQQARRNSIIEKKRAEFNARRRIRKLD